MSVITIDGMHGEGGGQMIRYATVLAAITRKSVRITNIRANRPKGGGINAQLLSGLNAMVLLADMKLSGNKLKSTEVTIEPNLVDAKFQTSLTIDTKTAASVTLISQMLLPWIMYHPCEIQIIGGTNVDHSPPIEYLCDDFIPILREFGFDIELVVLKRGTYPKGGGHIILTSKPNNLRPFYAKIIDPHLQDQLLIYEALIPGSRIEHTIELTEHSKSAKYVIARMLEVAE